MTNADVASAAAIPTAAPVPNATADRAPSPRETASSAARRSAAGDAPPGQWQASHGVGPVDLGSPALVASTEGLSRGAASLGSGEPNTAAATQTPRLGRSSPVGEANAAGDAGPISRIAATNGTDPGRQVGPQIDARGAHVARSRAANGAGPPGSSGSGEGAATGVPLGTANGSGDGAGLARAESGRSNGTPNGAADGTGVGLARADRRGGAADGTGEAPSAEPIAVTGTTPGGNGTAPRGPRTAGVGRQASGGSDAAALPGRPGVEGAVGVGRASRNVGEGIGPRNPLGASDDSPSLAGESGAGPLGRATRGTPGGAGDAPAAAVVALPPRAAKGPERDAEGLAPGGQEIARREAGVEVDMPAPPGAGGLALGVVGEIGLPDRRARRDVDMASLQIARFVLDKSGGRRGGAGGDDGNVVPTYMLRERELRSQVAEQFGGNAKSEEAVELGLAFLARTQQPDGSWTLHGWPGEPRGDRATTARNARRSETAGTGLALLTFLGAGYDHTDGPYQDVVRRGLDWLVKKQKQDGDLFTGGDDPEVRMYSHGIAAIPLAEAYAMSRDPALQEPVRKALQFTLKAQDLKWGGWRYTPGRQADTSVTGWQMMGLKSGELSGFGVPPSAYDGVTRWLDFAARGPEGNRLSRYAYLPATNAREESDRIANPAMTAESLLMRLYLGWDRSHPALQSGADYLLANLPPSSFGEPGRRDCYYWYYGTQVMYQMQGRHWKGWNDRLRPLLVNTQVKQGDLAGSWDPRGDKWGEQGGRLYVTAMHLLMLEVYYRHLPLFRLEEAAEAAKAE